MTGAADYRVDHASIARERIEIASQDVSDNWRSSTGEHKADMIALAQVHATLALVEQQRIANLIALTDLSRKTTKEDVGYELDELGLGVGGYVWTGLGL